MGVTRELKAPEPAQTLTQLIKAQAFGLGFNLVGVTSLGPASSIGHFRAWLDRGFAGSMAYLERGRDKRADTRLPLENTRSAVVVALDYGGREEAGPVARYARGDDYHDIMESRLRELHSWIQSETGRTVDGKAYVDTGPILERELARQAGLGWFGKNTNLINPRTGSFFFIGALLLDLELDSDAPFATEHCGTCTRCIDACPTDAIVEPHVIDARRCISYLTIENRDSIPLEFRDTVGSLLYGCDICQDVCPWNEKFASDLAEPGFAARPTIAGRDARSLALELLAMTPADFAEAFRNSPMKRAKLRGLKRNAAIVLGNVGGEESVAALTDAVRGDDAVLSEHAAWALAKINS